jgi:hypothetical protein
MEVAVSTPTPRKPVLCRLNLHRWDRHGRHERPSVNGDGDDYRHCTAWGKVSRLPPGSLYQGTAVPLSPGRSAAASSFPQFAGAYPGLPAVDYTCWAPDPTGTHELRLIRNARWTPYVVTAGVLSSDATLSGPASFDWSGPAAAPTRSTASEWLPAGTYVFRSKWQRSPGEWSRESFQGPRPVWYSAVWTHSRPIFLIEDNGKRLTAVDTGIGYPAARKSPLRLHTQFSDSGLNIRITSNGAVIDLATRTRIASTYSVANKPPAVTTGDHTVVITVPNAIPMRLGLLTLSYATRKRPLFETGGP